MDRILPNFVYALSLTRSMLVLLILIFRKFATELRPLNDVRIQILFNILRMNGQNLTKFCTHIIIDKIYVGMVNCQFLFNILRTNRLTKTKFCIHIIIDKIYVGMVNCQFLFNILRTNRLTKTKFCIHIIIDKIYIGIVNRHFFANLQQSYVRPLIDVRIQFLFNILRMNRQNLTKFCIHITIDKIYVGIVNCYFSQICNRVTALDWRQNSVFFFNILRTNRLIETKFCIDLDIPLTRSTLGM